MTDASNLDSPRRAGRRIVSERDGLPEPSLAERLLTWFEHHGRHDLPWQQDATPYRVWVSEIMLQQTQVAAVIPYFEQFVARFPDVAALAAASQDEVLRYWSGLGYYSRARNLHSAACLVRDRHGGRIPRDRAALEALPGIGASTAAAILALSYGDRHAILDGNVKRVLARYHGVEGWPGQGAALRQLWSLAEAHTPHRQVAAYTQAIMDLGATVCTRSRPACGRCPLSDDCTARRWGRQGELPAPRPRRQRPTRTTCFVLAVSGDGRVLLQRRPSTGVWAGLWGFPEAGSMDEAIAWGRALLGREPALTERWQPLSHGFTHFRLEIHPLVLRFEGPIVQVMEGGDRLWYKLEAPEPGGIPVPVRSLLDSLHSDWKRGQ